MMKIGDLVIITAIAGDHRIGRIADRKVNETLSLTYAGAGGQDFLVLFLNNFGKQVLDLWFPEYVLVPVADPRLAASFAKRLDFSINRMEFAKALAGGEFEKERFERLAGYLESNEDCKAG